LAVALSFCRLLGLGCPKQAFAKIATPRNSFVSTFAIAQTPTKQPALRLSRTKNLHFAKATFPGFSAVEFKAYFTVNGEQRVMNQRGWCKDEAAWLYASRASGKNRN
jgi:uncharacterized protein YchJ